MTRQSTSRLAGFYQLSPAARLQHIRSFSDLSNDDIKALQGGSGTLTLDHADHMIENVVGTYTLPLGVATNFRINGRDHLIPMVIEEPSVVVSASFAAKLVRMSGGFQASSSAPLMIGQIQLVEVGELDAARQAIQAATDQVLALANAQSPTMAARGGGAQSLDLVVFPTSPRGPMLVVYLIIDCRDAMGANAVNSMCEAVAPLLEQLSGGRAGLRILSNLSDRRLACARAVVTPAALAHGDADGAAVVDGILWASALATVDPYRAATHNKGILNGIDALVIASGNDWRAVESGAHAYAARSGRYQPLSTWEVDAAGNLVGCLELPLALGIVGGATRVHPTARAALALLQVESAQELACIGACVGLASNLAALRALVTDGIQRGHMALHARQMALAVGAVGPLVDRIAQTMITEQTIKSTRARELLATLQVRSGDD